MSNFKQERTYGQVLVIAPNATDDTGCKMKLILCSCNADVKKTSLFFEFFVGFIASWKKPFFHASYNNSFNLKSLCIVQGNNRNRIPIFALLQFLHQGAI